MRKMKKKLAEVIALACTIVLGVSTYTVYADKKCNDGEHIPEKEKIEVEYTQCGGGLKGDYYRCSICGYVVDENGNLVYAEGGNGAHITGTELNKAD